MPVFTHQYDAEINAEINGGCTCPPSNAASLTGAKDAFRWVFPSCDASSFIPQAVTNKKIIKNKPCSQKCRYFSLSFHETEKASIDHWMFLHRNNPMIGTIVGSAIAAGQLNINDGLVTPTDNHGHFELHQAANNLLHPRFNVVRMLP